MLGKQVHVGKFGTNITFETHLVIWTRRDNSTAVQRRLSGWAPCVMEEVSQRLVWFWPSFTFKSEQGAFCYICNRMYVVFFRELMWRFESCNSQPSIFRTCFIHPWVAGLCWSWSKREAGQVASQSEKTAHTHTDLTWSIHLTSMSLHVEHAHRKAGAKIGTLSLLALRHQRSPAL